MVARGISTDGGPPALAVESCCLDGRVGLAKQLGKRVAHRLSKWPTDMEMDGIMSEKRNHILALFQTRHAYFESMNSFNLEQLS